MSDLLDFSPPGQATFSLAGAKARFYDAGTTTPRTVYADEAETVPHPSPLLADSSGRFAQAFVSGGAVKVVVTQADDSTGYTLDPCVKVAATGAAASSISFSPTTELPFNNVQDAIEGLAGLNIGRNRIINGQGRINQRGYVSGTNTSGANEYTLDRWRVVTSGQNLTFTGTDAGRTMTAPAGGVEQVIEGANIEGGTYVLNWTGTATATVNGTARAKGETFTLTANANATVRFTSGTFTDVQLELGSTPTVFERLPINQELANCQRYYEAHSVGNHVSFSGNVTSGLGYFTTIRFATRKRGVPSIVVTHSDAAFFPLTASTAAEVQPNGFRLARSANATGNGYFSDFWTADAEL